MGNSEEVSVNESFRFYENMPAEGYPPHYLSLEWDSEERRSIDNEYNRLHVPKSGLAWLDRYSAVTKESAEPICHDRAVGATFLDAHGSTTTVLKPTWRECVAKIKIISWVGASCGIHYYPRIALPGLRTTNDKGNNGVSGRGYINKSDLLLHPLDIHVGRPVSARDKTREKEKYKGWAIGDPTDAFLDEEEAIKHAIDLFRSTFCGPWILIGHQEEAIERIPAFDGFDFEAFDYDPAIIIAMQDGALDTAISWVEDRDGEEEFLKALAILKQNRDSTLSESYTDLSRPNHL